MSTIGFSKEQFISKQFVGTILAAVFKTVKYKRATPVPSTKGTFIPPIIEYGGTVLPVHAVTQEAYEYNADVTQHPIESGAIYSDHVILKPIRLLATLEISNYDGVGKKAEKAKTAFDIFEQVWKAREPMSILTTHTLLTDMILTSFIPETTVTAWGALTIRAVFQQVKQVTLETTRFSSYQVQGDWTGNSRKQLGTNPLSSVDSKNMGEKPVSVVSSKAQAFTPLTQQLYKQFGMIQ